MRSGVGNITMVLSVKIGEVARNFATLGRKVVAIGRNYRMHAEELKNPVPSAPFWFLKPPSAYVLPGASIVLPEGVESIHHEVELGVVVGRRCKNVDEQHALDNVAGYCVALDMTARCWQDAAKKKGLPWTAAKGFDTSLPVGPFIPASNVPDPMALTLWCRVNGVMRQRGTTADMLFSVPQLISVVSKVHTLEEGDLLLTGTPAGVGPVAAGDSIEVGIEELATTASFSIIQEAASTRHAPC